MKILVVQPEGIGEAVYTTPVLRALMADGHQVHIGVRNPGSLQAYLLNIPGVRRVLPMEDAATVRKAGFDAIAVCSGWPRSHSLRKAYGCQRFVHPPPIGPSGYQGHEKRHVSDFFFTVAEQLGYKGAPPEAWVGRTPSEPSIQNQRPWLALCIGYMKKPVPKTGKHWGDQNFADLASRFKRATGGAAVLIGSTEDDRANGRKIAQLSKGAAESFCGRLSYPQIVGLLETSDLVVGNSTGLVHVAAVLGARTLEMWKSGAPIWRWGVRGAHAETYKNPSVNKVVEWCHLNLS